MGSPRASGRAILGACPPTPGPAYWPWSAICGPGRRSPPRLTHRLRVGARRRRRLLPASGVCPRPPEAWQSAGGAQSARMRRERGARRTTATARGPCRGARCGAAGRSGGGARREGPGCGGAVPGVRASAPRLAVRGRGLRAEAERAPRGPGFCALRGLHVAAGLGGRPPAGGWAWPLPASGRATQAYIGPSGCRVFRGLPPLRLPPSCGRVDRKAEREDPTG